MVNTGILGLATHTEYHVPIGPLGHPLSSLVTRLDQAAVISGIFCSGCVIGQIPNRMMAIFAMVLSISETVLWIL